MKQVLIFLLGCCAIFYSRHTEFQKLSIEPLFVKPPEFLEHMVFGYKEVVAHSLWIRAIQDLDYCEDKKQDSGCVNRWIYHMLDKVTDLLPNYRYVYSLGAVALSIVVGDRDGAGELFDKGIKNFPEDWRLAYKAAYYYIYEQPQPLRAAELLKKAGFHGAPSWVFSLASRLYTKAGRAELGEIMARTLEKEGYSSEIVKKVRERLKSP